MEVLSLRSCERDENQTCSSGSSLGSLTDSIILSESSIGFDSSTGYNTDPMSEAENDEPKPQLVEVGNELINSTNAKSCDENLKTISPQDVTREIQNYNTESKLTYETLIDKDNNTRLKKTSKTYATIGAIF